MQTALLLLQTAIRFFVSISGGYTNNRLAVAYLNIPRNLSIDKS